MDITPSNNPLPGSAPAPAGRPVPVPPRPVPKPPAGGLREGFTGLRVSLMPSELEGGKAPDLRRRLLILLFVIVLETIIIGGVNFWLIQATSQRQSEHDQLQKQGNDISSQAGQLGRDLTSAIQFDQQARAVADALDKHLYWTEFFKFLENNTLPSIRFERFDGQVSDGVFSFDIFGDSYRDVAEQIVAWSQNPSISRVRATAAQARVTQTGSIEGVAVTVVLNLKPDVWSRPVTTAAK